ncbi:MAG: hypothetical protein QOG79_6950, partial [Mycobacterium sp.]|nr:hypothetical protein [Mycobacterium sp.]
MKAWKNIVFAWSILASCGCTHLATVKTMQPRVPLIASSDAQLKSATECLIRAEREAPLVALGDDLAAARLSLSVLERHPDDSSAQSTYNFSVGRAVENLKRANLQPWRLSSSIPFNQGSFLLSAARPVDAEHDPGRYDLFP